MSKQTSKRRGAGTARSLSRASLAAAIYLAIGSAAFAQEAAPDAAPVYSEVALMGCRMSGGEALCGSCNTTLAAAEYDHVVGAILEEHSLARVDSQGRIRVSVTSEMDHADFPHNGSRAGIEAAIADAQAWCEAFHPERSEVITDRRETDIATGDDE